MTDPEFLAAVRERGGYADNAEGPRVSEAVPSTLGDRPQPAVAGHPADQLPLRIGRFVMRVENTGRSWGVHEFVHQVARAAADDEETAHRHAEVVPTTLAATLSGDELNKPFSRLPVGYAALLGHTDRT
ncbi:DUF2267 domain-containing protein [Streptomyces phaeoluteigriseus]|uniref:DUF2267 domain-containing protein n=1 Tax=Streptomyces phaeoluteigriseus TaxID=114686 RepID=A0ABY4ZA88_9ACTN|nr:DUF2267 domain-containing protein [Streptomyces phaeoluteigriseus]USQ85242.1 DUF2267 domain-containing protein [Streptomyces phaeoluteigriseus]